MTSKTTGGVPVRLQVFVVYRDGKKYSLSRTPSEDWPFWLENGTGEGMSVSEHDLFEALNRIWKEGF